MSARRSLQSVVAALALVASIVPSAKADPLTEFIDAVSKKIGGREEATSGSTLKADTASQVEPSVSDAAAALAPDTPQPRQGKPTGKQAAQPSLPQPSAQPRMPAQVPALMAAPLPGETEAPLNKGGIPLGRPRPATSEPSTPVVATTPVAAKSVASAPVPSDSPDPLPTTRAEVIDSINGHFNKMDQMRARFVQVGGYGQRLTGTVTLKRPAHFQFTYDDPHTLQIVSDGRSVAIQDRNKGASDVYSIGLTPLRFLAKQPFDIVRDAKITKVAATPEGIVSVSFDDTSTFGGTSSIEMQFDALGDRLTRLVIVDEKKLRTTITLSDVEVWNTEKGK